MVYKLIFISIISVLVVSSCNGLPEVTPTLKAQSTDVQETNSPQSINAEEEYLFKTSEPGFFTISGILTLMDPMLVLPTGDDGIYLVPIDEQSGSLSTIPQFEEGTVPQADVDERTFEFVFTNIEPGQYAVVVLSRNGPQVPARFLENESLAIFTIEDTDDPREIDIGNLMVP